MAEWRTVPGPGENARIIRSTFFNAAQDDYTEAPAQDADKFELMQNVMPPLNGTIDRRWGFSEFSNPGMTTRRMFSVYFPVSYDVNGNATNADGRLRVILTSSSNVAAINHTGAVVRSPVFTPSAGADHPHCTVANTYAYFADGVAADLKKWTGNEAAAPTSWGIAPSEWTPGDVLANSNNSEPVTLKEGRRYALAVRNPQTGHSVLFTDADTLQPIYSGISGPVNEGHIEVPLPDLGTSFNLINAGYTELIILGTADGGDTSILYEVVKTLTVVIWSLNVGPTATPYRDTKTEDDLLSSNIWAEIDEDGRGRGLYGSFAPSIVCPKGKFPTYHRGRLYLLQNNRLFYTRSLEEVTTSTGLVAAHPEECFSPSNVIELSTQDNENGVGMLSDGVNLYIGTVQSIRVMGGDPPNQDGPRTLYANAGLLNSQTWRRVWHAGQASGAMWMTPDKMVLASDGNTYRDVGHPIQDTLARVTSTAMADKAHAAFVTDGAQELYILALPVDGATECNLLAVYSITSDTWVIWEPTAYSPSGTAFPTTITAMNGEMVPWLTPFNIGGPVGYFASGTYNQLFKWDFTGVQDYVSGSNSSGYSTQAKLRTSWLDMDSPESIKYLRMLDVLSAQAADDITLTVEGASDTSDFTTPTTLSAGALRTNLHGKKFYSLITVPAKYRFYRFTLTFSPKNVKDILNYLAIEYRASHLA